MKYLIGLDVGTSSTKAVLFDENGTTIFVASENYEILRPQKTWAEQNPTHFLDATISVLKQLAEKSKIKSEDIVSMGITGQMHGLVLLDKNNKVLRPAIIWCDNRTESELEIIKSSFKKEHIAAKTGNVPMAAFTLAKLLWVKRNEPEIYNQIDKIMLPKDYVRFGLTATFYSDYSDMSGTQLFDVTKHKFAEDILSYLNLNENQFPQVVSCYTPVAKLTKSMSKATGLSENMVVVAGSGDQTASAFGNGIFKLGEMSINLGSSGVLFLPSQFIVDYSGAIQTFSYYDAQTYHIMGVTQGCGISFKWLKDNFYDENDAYSLMEKEVETEVLSEQSELFLPYLQGERTPILNPKAKGLLFNLTSDTNRGAIARAVFEGVAFSLFHSYQAITNLGVIVSSIKVTGGAAKNKTFVQMLSDVFNRKIEVKLDEETGCLGSAMMAALGAGIYQSPKAAYEAMGNSHSNPIIPNLNNHKIYQKRYLKYRDIYQSIKHLY